MAANQPDRGILPKIQGDSKRFSPRIKRISLPADSIDPRHDVCGVYVVDAVEPLRDLGDGPKRVYRWLQRRAGANRCCWQSHETIAEQLGKSPRQIRSDIRALEVYGLIGHMQREGGRSNTYYFKWHSCFERQNPASQIQDGEVDVPETASRERQNPASQNAFERQNPATESISVLNLEKRIQSSSSSGSSEQRKRTEDEDDAVLKSFLHGWMKELHWRAGGFPEPPAAVLNKIRAAAHRWTDGQIVEGFKQNLLISAPSDKNPPKAYGYFATVISNYYAQRNGIAPEITAELKAPIQRTGGLATMADLDEADKPARCKHGAPGICTICDEHRGPAAIMAANEQRRKGNNEAPKYNCTPCKDTGLMHGMDAICTYCEAGRRRNRRNYQGYEWTAIYKQQSKDVRHIMDFEVDFAWSEDLDHRQRLLEQFRDGTHPLLNKATPMPMVVEQGIQQAASAAA